MAARRIATPTAVTVDEDESGGLVLRTEAIPYCCGSVQVRAVPTLRWPVRRWLVFRASQAEPQRVPTATMTPAGDMADENLVRPERMAVRAVGGRERHELAPTPNQRAGLWFHGGTLAPGTDTYRSHPARPTTAPPAGSRRPRTSRIAARTELVTGRDTEGGSPPLTMRVVDALLDERATTAAKRRREVAMSDLSHVVIRELRR